MTTPLHRPRRSALAGTLAAAAAAAALAIGGTAPAAAASPAAIRPAAAAATGIPLTISNNSGQGPVYIYILGEVLDGSGTAGWADAQGTFHPWPHTGEVPVSAPDASIATIEAGQSQTITLPSLSGRVYYSYGEKLDFKIVLDGKLVQPAVHAGGDANRDKLFNWTEYTLNDNGLWINSTQVDFFSAPYQVGVERQDGTVLSTGRLKPDAYTAFFDQLAAQPGWEGLIQRDPSGRILRALSPGHGAGSGLLGPDVVDGYIDEVWESYRNRDIVITPFDHEPQTIFTGRVTGDRWVFRDTSGAEVASFEKPDAASVYGCDGKLHAPNDHVVGPIARTLCQGFFRSTILDEPQQPAVDASTYYQGAYANHYGRLVHEAMVTGRAYAFAFDDVGAHESLVHDGNPAAAFISLDPFTGSATPLGEELPDSTGGNNGGTLPGEGGGSGALPAGTGPISAGSLCLDVPWGDATPGTQAQVAHCSGNDAQRWTRSAAGEIRALGACLDARSGGTTSGTVVQLWDCNGSGAQKWTYDAGSKELRNAPSGLCLDASGGLTDGAKTILHSCHGGDNQKWTL